MQRYEELIYYVLETNDTQHALGRSTTLLINEPYACSKKKILNLITCSNFMQNIFLVANWKDDIHF